MEKGICLYSGDTYVFDYFRIQHTYILLKIPFRKMALVHQNTLVKTRRKKPPARSGHIAVCVGDYMLVWGGYADRVS